MKSITHVDSEISRLLSFEKERQQNTISLIASENYCSQAVQEATGSALTNKYAEGYPGKRYYAGCAIVDQIEQLAIDRARTLFSVSHANVQPHAGSQANMAAYAALLNPGDTLMGMSLAAGGHLTHGHKVNFSGNIYNVVQYGVNKDTGLLDFNEIAYLAEKHTPKVIVCGASAYSRIIDFTAFRKIADTVGAYLIADIAHIAGLVVTGEHPNPAGIADIITTTTHKTLRGPRAGLIMSSEVFAQQIDRAIIPGLQGGPFMHTIAAKAIAFKEASEPSFTTYQKEVIRNAQTMAQTFIDLGYTIVTGGTDNHLFIIDLRNKGINGLIAQNILEKVGITSSRSCIPFDPEKPWVTSGIRFGTPAITTRGAQQKDIIALAHLIDETFTYRDNEEKIMHIQQKVQRMAQDLRIP